MTSARSPKLMAFLILMMSKVLNAGMAVDIHIWTPEFSIINYSCVNVGGFSVLTSTSVNH